MYASDDLILQQKIDSEEINKLISSFSEKESGFSYFSDVEERIYTVVKRPSRKEGESRYEFFSGSYCNQVGRGRNGTVFACNAVLKMDSKGQSLLKRSNKVVKIGDASSYRHEAEMFNIALENDTPKAAKAYLITDSNNNSSMLLMKRLPGMTLKRLRWELKRDSYKYDKETVLKAMIAVLDACLEFENKHLIHNDSHGDNILVDMDKLEARLIDFEHVSRNANGFYLDGKSQKIINMIIDQYEGYEGYEKMRYFLRNRQFQQARDMLKDIIEPSSPAPVF